jgi:hypothetical protein
MPRAAVVLRTALLAALVGLLCLTPAVAMARPATGMTGMTGAAHHKGWNTSDTQGTAQGHAGSAPSAHRTGPRLEHELEPGAAGLPGLEVSLHRAATFVGRSAAPAERLVPRAATCPKMRAPPG